MIGLALIVVGAILLALLIRRDLKDIRLANRKIEEETRERLAKEGLADTEPEDVWRVLDALADIHGVDSVHSERNSNVVHLLARPSLTEQEFVSLQRIVQLATPIGLSARVVRSREEIPESCFVAAKGWPA